ncbi:delta-lactam-biosynthetic de-N-acetylase [Paenibacillus mucilaginosus]|uniref:Xylanase/chitin deacetylase n=1 Tax=Paenibacillus mucilaginosus 3016 TaxID=1116391 RepID=H6NH88_9BACL|nr:polysaccharide deacetylase family protein [Paenibacillus mucilaginosus]AFC28766.1 xylanase/chitin deacetylase [Paenibacillus mucilaginosus 3016]MCG7215720.1 polysaccharide deacetylase family protein [Paenibacillus mucilaginosus]WDM29351.1 polysaccharide deacetylase family protein [Paenibacillus mucilaginosus]WFA17537.1 xylanase deacetylase [Paenibacillus mucilaginosus]
MNPTARMIMLTAALGALLTGCSVKVEDAVQPEAAKTPTAAGETAEGGRAKETKPAPKETAGKETAAKEAAKPAGEAKPAADAKKSGSGEAQPKDAAAGADGAAASASKPAAGGSAKPDGADASAGAAKPADSAKNAAPAPRNPAAAAVGSAASKPAPAQGTGDRKALSWYYMKKPKGQVPSFPGETKSYPQGTKALWVGTGKKVYLTIDTGGPLGDTKLLMKSLRDNKAKANFFIAGYNVKKDPDFVRQLVKDGHLVANHTMTHSDMNEQTDEQIVKEIKDYEKLYKEVTGENIQPYFRFPYGRYNMHILKTVSDMGYTSVFWSTAMRDWEPRKNGAEDPYNDIMNNLHDGNIILMHQGSPENIQALDRIIKEVRKAGYEFALLTDIKPPATP